MSVLELIQVFVTYPPWLFVMAMTAVASSVIDHRVLTSHVVSRSLSAACLDDLQPLIYPMLAGCAGLAVPGPPDNIWTHGERFMYFGFAGVIGMFVWVGLRWLTRWRGADIGELDKLSPGYSVRPKGKRDEG